MQVKGSTPAFRSKLAQTKSNGTDEYRNLFRHANDPILIIEPESEIVLDVNDRACEAYGYSREEFIGRSLKEVTKDVAGGERYLRDLVSSGQTTQCYESTHRRSDGEEIVYLINASVIEYAGRTAILAINRDITERARVKEELERNLSLLESTLQATADGILAVDINNHIIAANQKFLEMWAIPHSDGRPQISSSEMSEYVIRQVQDPESFRAVIEHSVAEPDEVHVSTLELLDGRIVERYTQPQKFEGKTVGRVLSFRDITTQRQAVEKLREKEARLETLLDSMSEGLLQVDGEDTIVYTNNFICGMTGYSQQELLGMKWSKLLVDEGQEFVDEINRRRSEGLSDRYEIRIQKKTGDLLWVIVGGAPIFDAHGSVIGSMGVFTDITERKRAEEQLLHDAFHDGLTGLANRTLFMDHLRLAIKRTKGRNGKPFAVLYLDFDRFKVINDSLGHGEGDKLLKYIARRLENCTRSGDLVARLGGDEFVILLSDLEDTSEALLVAERIQNDLKTSFDLGGREIYTSTSIGITLSTSGYTNADDMLRDADIAMYSAKALGKARYAIFDQAMHHHASWRLQIETEMRTGIDKGEFSVNYQPIISLNSGALVGFEALLRWNHPKRGNIPPDEFIPVAEENGLIMKLGQMVLEQSCRQLKNWQTRLPAAADLTVSVNLSSKEFLQLDLAEKIGAILKDAELDPRYLKLEITESHIMENNELAVQLLERLRKSGIEMCLDDFGTGYSSLSYLHKLPVQYIKVDRSFITRMVQSDENREIVNTIMRLAQNLKMKVIAEGIETTDQLLELVKLNCDYGQGYYFAKPLTPRDAKAFIENKLQTTGIMPYTAPDTVQARA